MIDQVSDSFCLYKVFLNFSPGSVFADFLLTITIKGNMVLTPEMVSNAIQTAASLGRFADDLGVIEATDITIQRKLKIEIQTNLTVFNNISSATTTLNNILFVFSTIDFLYTNFIQNTTVKSHNNKELPTSLSHALFQNTF